MRIILISLMFFVSVISPAAEAQPPALQKNDYPVIVTIHCTDIEVAPDRIVTLPGLASRTLPLLEKYGYALSQNNDYSKYTSTFLIGNDSRYPKYIEFRSHEENGAFFLDVLTRGELTADGYSGHSDEFTFRVAALIKPLFNTHR